jgi:hypothetical protein
VSNNAKLTNPSDAISTTNVPTVLYCFVSYKQSVSASNRSFSSGGGGAGNRVYQQALVIVSQLPIPNLAYRMLPTIEISIAQLQAHGDSRNRDGDEETLHLFLI